MSLVLDTGPLLAGLDASDADHARCKRLIDEATEDLVGPALVLAELNYWCGQRLHPDPWLSFLDDVLAGVYRIEPPTHTDLERSRELQHQYRDLRLGVVDATVLALTERLGERKLATLDYRHFATVRPAHVEALVLLP
jgi:predicted nucleic acid-binding protein